MLRFVADENFNGAIVRGLLRASPNLDIVTIQAVGLAGASDPEVLEWAATAERLLLTHDVRTMPVHVKARLEAGLPMPGVIEVSASLPIGRAIEEILMLGEASEEGEWTSQIVRVPL